MASQVARTDAAFDLARVRLGEWKANLAAYTRQCGSIAAPPLWRDAAREILSGADTPPVESSAPREGARRLAQLIDAARELDTKAQRLERLGSVLISAGVEALATAGRSHSQYEALEEYRKSSVVSSRMAVQAVARAFEDASVESREIAVATSLAELNAACGYPFDTSSPTPLQLYCAALLSRAAHGEREAVTAQLAQDRYIALGALDDRESARADALALAGYHPLQAMGYMPAPVEAVPSGSGSSASVDLTPPGAKIDVVYDASPLLDPIRAKEFGPIATMASGLNYNLLKRLDTIRATPIPPPTGDPSGTPDGSRPTIMAGPLMATTSRGASVKRIGPYAPPQTEWAPFAGVQPLVTKYCEASAAVITEGLAREAETVMTGNPLVERFNARLDKGVLPPSTDHLQATLDREYIKLYAQAAPNTAADWIDLVCCTKQALTIGARDYISAAVAQAGAVQVQRTAATIESGYLPKEMLRREVWASQAIARLSTTRSLRRSIAAEILAAQYQLEDVFDLEEPRRGGLLRETFRSAVAKALAQSTEPLNLSPITLKGFAALQARSGDAL